MLRFGRWWTVHWLQWLSLADAWESQLGRWKPSVGPAIYNDDEWTAVHVSALPPWRVVGCTVHRADIHEPSLKTLDSIPDHLSRRCRMAFSGVRPLCVKPSGTALQLPWRHISRLKWDEGAKMWQRAESAFSMTAVWAWKYLGLPEATAMCQRLLVSKQSHVDSMILRNLKRC